jgi:hypothetical protein
MFRSFGQASIGFAYPLEPSRDQINQSMPPDQYNISSKAIVLSFCKNIPKNALFTVQYLEGYPACQGCSECHRSH